MMIALLILDRRHQSSMVYLANACIDADQDHVDAAEGYLESW